ncbi:DUF5405 family protein [Serratia marcescens]|uniref:DUF5405 family protein n=1 Tax=Serratia marcescens TaxID=615 RepID=UPI0024C47B81|nr:DUF5405 family protein [Serratia marcescens]MDK1710823.1 DUF5405 family protein [Serratia marcescens]
MNDARGFIQWLIDNGRETEGSIMPLYAAWRDRPVSEETARLVPAGRSAKCCIDHRYVIAKTDKTFTLYELRHNAAGGRAVVIALYADEVALVSDLINHSIRQTKVASIGELVAETQRLAMQCDAALAEFQ